MSVPSNRLVLFIAFLAVGCADPDEPRNTSGGSAGVSENGASGTGGSSAWGGSAGLGGSARSCNELELDAPAVGLTYAAGPPPEPRGGEIADGIYFVTAQIAYEAAPGSTDPLGRTEVEIAGTVWQEVNGAAVPGGVSPDRHSTSILAVLGSQLELERTCPSAGAPESAPFTAESQSFTVYVSEAGMTVGTVFTKQ